jgi:hypothetical protein
MEKRASAKVLRQGESLWGFEVWKGGPCGGKGEKLKEM